MTLKKQRIALAKRFREAGVSWGDSHKLARRWFSNAESEEILLVENLRDNGWNLEVLTNTPVNDAFGEFEGFRTLWRASKGNRTINFKTDEFGGFEVIKDELLERFKKASKRILGFTPKVKVSWRVDNLMLVVHTFTFKVKGETFTFDEDENWDEVLNEL